MSKRGGFLIRFDEERRAWLLREEKDLERGFSDALSSVDWPLKEWEVCGLLLEPEIITHWALARRRRAVATAKVRVEFTQITPTNVSLSGIEEKVLSRLRPNIVRVRSGLGGRVPPVTWAAFKNALRTLDPESFAALERLEWLRDQSEARVDMPGVEIRAQERDATGVALDVFDANGDLRRRTLSGWRPSQLRLRSFLDGLEGVRTIEDQLIGWASI